PGHLHAGNLNGRRAAPRATSPTCRRRRLTAPRRRATAFARQACSHPGWWSGNRRSSRSPAWPGNTGRWLSADMSGPSWQCPLLVVDPGAGPVLLLFSTQQLAVRSAIPLCQQAGVSANGRGIYGSGSFGYEAQQVMRTAGLGAGAGQAHPAKGLHTHHGTDHITVNIDISHPDPAFDISSKALISALDAEGQTKTAAVDAGDDLVQICGAVAGDVQNRPERLLVELADTLQPERCGGDELASLAELLRNRSLCQQALHLTIVFYVLQELLAGC